jgi:hypothetical protein
LRFPIYEQGESFIVQLLFSEYSELEIRDSVDTVYFSKQKQKNSFGLDSFVTESIELSSNTISIQNFLKKSNGQLIFDNYNLRYGVFRNDSISTSQTLDKYGNILSSCQSGFCEEFSYSRTDSSFLRKLKSKGLIHEYIFNEDSKLTEVLSNDGVSFKIYYYDNGSIRLAERFLSDRQNASYEFIYSSGNLRGINTMEENSKREFQVSSSNNVMMLKSKDISISIYDPVLVVW